MKIMIIGVDCAQEFSIDTEGLDAAFKRFEIVVDREVNLRREDRIMQMARMIEAFAGLEESIEDASKSMQEFNLILQQENRVNYWPDNKKRRRRGQRRVDNCW